MKITKENKDDAILIKLEGWLDHENSPALGSVVDEIASAKDLTIDFADVEYISSAGIRQIVAANKKAKELNASFSVIHVRPDVMSVLAITGLDKKLNIKAD